MNLIIDFVGGENIIILRVDFWFFCYFDIE